jgi:hypothetical protein
LLYEVPVSKNIAINNVTGIIHVVYTVSDLPIGSIG